MGSPWDYFDEIFCINLPEDTKRKNQMINSFNILNIKDLTWVYSPRPEQYSKYSYHYAGEYGVVLSQLKALRVRLNNCNTGIVIFEDDVRFIENTNEVLTNCLTELPEDWDILYLGGSPRSNLENHSPHLAKVNKFTSAMAYAVSAKALEDFCKFYETRMSLKFPNACCDNILNDFILLEKRKGFVCIPPIAWDIPGWSTLRKGFRDYSGIMKKRWKENLPNEIKFSGVDL